MSEVIPSAGPARSATGTAWRSPGEAEREMPDLRIGSLCTGYGGLDMAVEEVFGASTVWVCQYEPPDKHGRENRHQYAAHVLAHHWPDIPNLGDLTKVDWAAVEPVDIITAGFPCTDISWAGLGAGIKEGTRSGLWLTIAQVLHTLRPRFVVLENVRAIVNRRPGLDVVLGSLAALGLDAEWTCVRASDVGAPHQRARWFLLAWPADTPSPRREGQNPQR
ncbi:DNA cytosine methyltransferase [Streptosporangium sp. NPDC051023]|uniref:DNA cytosine methyltransferase n=1 Tax=Streptosporangium sp. NPDC051023 TaxID=3155410 RepID=UPI00344F17A8